MNSIDKENARQPPAVGEDADDDKPTTASLKAVKSLIHEKPKTISQYDMTRSLLDSEDEEEEEEETNSRPTNHSTNDNDTESLAAASTIVHTNTKTDRRCRLHSMPPSTHKWDDFVRQGTRLKTLVQDAMQHLKTNAHLGDKRPREEEENIESPLRQRRRIEETEHTADLAREKTAEVILLQRKLKEAQANASALQATNESLREEAASTQQRLQRTSEALRIAGSNAAKARGDADAAEATAANLAQTLQSLQTVVTETKRASQVLHQEQQQVQAAAASVEAKLVQKDADLARAHKEVKTLRNQTVDLETAQQRWKDERANLDRSVQRQQEELDKIQRDLVERDALEQARKERATKVEQEWRQAQAMLVEATSGQAQAEETQALLQETIDQLQKANQNLHEQLSQHQDASAKEKERLHEALCKAEKEAQQLRIQAEASDEEMQRLRLDKSAADKQVAQLKGRLATLERRLASSSLVSPETNNDTSFDATASSNSLSIRLPPLGGASSGACCVCNKSAFGLMKTCQCGSESCDKRAHMACANRIQPGPSVSHPGTPAPKLPLVLCCSNAAAAANSN